MPIVLIPGSEEMFDGENREATHDLISDLSTVYANTIAIFEYVASGRDITEFGPNSKEEFSTEIPLAHRLELECKYGAAAFRCALASVMSSCGLPYSCVEITETEQGVNYFMGIAICYMPGDPNAKEMNTEKYVLDTGATYLRYKTLCLMKEEGVIQSFDKDELSHKEYITSYCKDIDPLDELDVSTATVN